MSEVQAPAVEPGRRPRHLVFGGKSPLPLPWKPLMFMEEYLTNLEIDGRKEKYVEQVKIGLSHFGMFCEKEGIKHPDEITRAHILRFQVYLTEYRKQDGELLAVSYRQAILNKVRSWINWMDELEYIERNPWQRIRIGRQLKKPNPLEDDEVQQIFNAHRRQAFSISPFYYHRREVILVLLFGWGLRIHELQALNAPDMDPVNDFVVAINKGGGRKAMPYGPEMKLVVERWLRKRGEAASRDEPALLIDSQGQRLSTHMLRKIVVDLGIRAGVQINPHRLRDTFGTKMLDGDAELERVMKLMGHTNTRQTLAYSRINDPKLAETHDRVMTPLLHQLLNGELP